LIDWFCDDETIGDDGSDYQCKILRGIVTAP